MHPIPEPPFTIPLHLGLFVLALTSAGCWGEAQQKETATATATRTDPDPTAGSGGGDDAGAETTGAPAPDTCVELRDEARAIFKAKCSACHSGPGAQVFDNVEDVDALVAKGLVKGGDPAGSKLYQLIDADVMPKTEQKLSKDEKVTVFNWIEECTVEAGSNPLDPPACPQNNFITTEAMVGRMITAISDLNKVEPDDQPFIRFVTLTHLHNAGYCPEQIEVYRQATSKVLNSLSSATTITKPVAIDPEATIFMIDLRDYGWDADLWELLALKNPFAVEYTFESALQLRGLTGTAVPFQMADWLVTDASQAPLYDQILYERVFKIKGDIFSPVDPLTRFDLEAFLGIDVEANIALEASQDVGRTHRGGFQISGVSAQNRLIERHQFPDNFSRVYWLSYDFVSNVDLGNIFYHPLDFAAAGGEIIWNLPNGLQAYMLVNAEGERLDEADVDIVNNKEQGGAPIINGTSCMGCHYKGMRDAADEVRPFVLESVGVFDDLAVEQVSNLYATPEEFKAAIQADGDLFVRRVTQTGAPLLVGPYEVATAVYLAFEEQYIDMNRAAAELGLPAGKLLPQIGLLPDGLKMLNGGMVTRSSMRFEYGAAICNLKLGVTKACKPG